MSTPGASSSEWAAARGEKWRAHLAGMEATLAPIDAPLIGALRLDAPLRIADLACGGGGTTLEIARRAPAGSVVHGFDIASGMVDDARRRAEADGRSIPFATADIATALPPGDPYERVLSRFGVMFFDDPPAGFANVARWLSPRGRFAFAVWGPMADNPWTAIVRDAVAEVVDVPSPAPDAPGPFRYGDASALLALLRGAGLEEIERRDWRGALPIGGKLTATEAATFALSAFASFGALLANAGDEALSAARRSLTARFARHERDGAVWVDARVHLVTGARPR